MVSPMPQRRLRPNGAPPQRSHPSRAPRSDNGHQLTDAEAEAILNSLHAGDRRSSFAQALFPYDRLKYKTRGEWAKAVGTRVAADIRSHPELRLRMEALGYEPAKQGYTLEQRIQLIKFYKNNL